MKTAPVGNFPGAAAGKCLFALSWQPLPRSGQPEAATPGLCTRVASAPGAWSCIQGKPPLGSGQSYFPAHSAPGPDGSALGAGPDGSALGAGPDDGPDGVDAAFMLFERDVGWLAGAVARAIRGAGRASVTVASPVPRLTAWMPRSCRKSCMKAATMSYGQAGRTRRRGISGHASASGAQGHQRWGLGPGAGRRLLGVGGWGPACRVPGAGRRGGAANSGIKRMSPRKTG
jgi:hypothetical protein